MIEVGNIVAIKTSGDIGVVEEVYSDPLEYRVRSRGVSTREQSHSILPLTDPQVHVLNIALLNVSKAIDDYYEEDLYDPVYSEEGTIIYSSAAAAALRAVNFPSLVVELSRLAEKVSVLEDQVLDLEAKSGNS